MATVEIPHWPALARPLLAPTPDGRVRFTRDAYERMFEAGIFVNSPKVELLNGEIVMMSPIGPQHVALISILTEFFAKRLPDSMQLRIQAPVLLSNDSEPEPDVAVVRRRQDSYRNRHPSSADILLLIEVSESSRHCDFEWKRRIYAASEIAEYWVIDADGHVVVVHRDASEGDYQDVKSIGPASKIAPSAAPNCQLDVGLLFP